MQNMGRVRKKACNAQNSRSVMREAICRNRKGCRAREISVPGPRATGDEEGYKSMNAKQSGRPCTQRDGTESAAKQKPAQARRRAKQQPEEGKRGSEMRVREGAGGAPTGRKNN